MKPRDGLTWLTALPIAHRGLHDSVAGKPENSMAAFRAAITGSYAIECDLQPSADGIPMVFHDDTLDRMTGETGNIRDWTAERLSQVELSGTAESIPTLADLLAETAGKVPLVLELKPQPGRDTSFAAAVTALLKDYAGPVAVMSFDPGLLTDLRKAAPGLPRGLVAEGNWRWFLPIVYVMLRRNVHFVSYSIDDLPTPAPLIARHLLGLPLICWTVRTDEQRRKAHRWTDQITFEGFTP
jgi:glycerophosphoryl diester phosphodiesterase